MRGDPPTSEIPSAFLALAGVARGYSKRDGSARYRALEVILLAVQEGRITKAGGTTRRPLVLLGPGASLIPLRQQGDLEVDRDRYQSDSGNP